MAKYLWVGVSLFCLFFQLTAQTPAKIKLTVRNTPLNQVLIDLKENYGFQFAYDSDLLSQYEVSVNKIFHTEEETLIYLTRNLPLKVEKSGDVFLIIPLTAEEPKPVVTRISGQVLAARTFEPLPYSYVLVNRKPLQADNLGQFNFIASADTSYNLQISHLGYFIYDTIVTQSIHRQFFLSPQIERIKEVVILSNPVEKSTLIGDKAGYLKINHQIAPILPGHGDNSVFNLLRLMPGILASGESSNDLLIWGAYESHSKIQFDGFTLFGLKNFNDNIGVVNPFMIKNIEVMKAGYEARYGGRVGGIVDIQGKDGSLQKPGFTFNINSTTVNTMLQLPLSKSSSLLAAYRQTYYQLYEPTSLSLFSKGNSGSNGSGSGNTNSESIEFDVQPDFIFRDANLKFTHRSDGGSYFSVSLYGGGDEFMYDIEGEYGRNKYFRNEEEENRQYGGAVQYNYPWSNGSATNISVGYSGFEQKAYQLNEVERIRTGIILISKDIDSENTVDEFTATATHNLSFQRGHQLIFGIGTVNNQVQLSRISGDEVLMDVANNSSQLFLYLQDELPVGKVLALKTGVRMVYSNKLNDWYLEPRASVSLNLTHELKLNASWGLYNQFISKTLMVDSLLNYAKFWMNSDGLDIPVLHAQHFVAGGSFNKNGFTISSEAFYKTTDGLARYYSGSNWVKSGFYQGNAKTYGVDVYVKKEYKRHLAWISYTLCNTKEHFPYYLKNYYNPAPHNQKHEFKFAGILNYKSFYFSANYIYGSGFDRYDFETGDGSNLNKDYKRLDASVVYKFKPGKIKSEAGISILNMLDADNVKYSNLGVTTIDEISLVGVYADAVPFTPAVFFKIEF